MKIDQLTIVILTHRNDQRFLDSLESAQIAQEVIILDNNSQNEWQELNKKYQFKIIEHKEKIKDFSEIRNSALKLIKTMWVLFLDSDEILSKNATNKIKKTIELNFYDALSIKRIDYFLNKPLLYGETGSIELIRMFKVGKGKFKRNVHEVVDYSGKLGLAEFEILHFSHQSIKDFLEKVSTFAYLDSKNQTTSKIENTIQMIFYPIGKFILNYFFKLGFLDGYRGIIYATIMSLHSFFVRVFYYENI